MSNSSLHLNLEAAPPEPAGLSNLVLYSQMNDLAKLLGITSEQALHDALTGWIERQKVVRMPSW